MTNPHPFDMVDILDDDDLFDPETDLVQAGIDMGRESCAFFSQLEAMGGPPKQQNAQVGFQFLDVITHRTLRTSAMEGGLGDASEPCDAVKDMDRIDVADSDHPPPLRRCTRMDATIEKLDI